MGITEEERRELERMRDAIARRYDELDDHCRWGAITDQERYDTLASEFGPDWLLTLSDLNALLHHKERRAPDSAVSILTIAGVAIILAFLAFTPALSGLATLEHTIPSGATLLDGDTIRLQPRGAILAVNASYNGPGSFTLHLEDAKARHTLLTGDMGGGVCRGCGKAYEEPLLLVAQTAGGSVRLESITYGDAR